MVIVGLTCFWPLRTHKFLWQFSLQSWGLMGVWSSVNWRVVYAAFPHWEQVRLALHHWSVFIHQTFFTWFMTTFWMRHKNGSEATKCCDKKDVSECNSWTLMLLNKTKTYKNKCSQSPSSQSFLWFYLVVFSYASQSFGELKSITSTSLSAP